MPKTVEIDGKKIVIGKEFPKMVDKAAEAFDGFVLHQELSRQKWDRIQTEIAKATNQTQKTMKALTKAADECEERLGYLKAINTRGVDVIVKWYEAAQDAKTPADRKKKLKEAERLTEVDEKRAEGILKDIVKQRESISGLIAAFNKAADALSEALKRIQEVP